MTELPPTIPEEVKEEFGGRKNIEKLRGIHGWAFGTVVKVDTNQNIVETYENAWVELFEDDEKLRVLLPDNDTYKQEYAFPTEMGLTDNKKAGFYVKNIKDTI